MVAMLTHSRSKKLCCLLVSLSLLHTLRFDLGLGRYFANGPCSDTKTSCLETLKAGDIAHLNHQRVAVCVTGQLRTLTLDPKDPSYPKAWGPMSTRYLPEANISVAESIQQNLYPKLVATTSTTTELDVFMYVSTRERNEHEPKVGNLSACMPLRPRIKNGNLFCHVVREEEDFAVFPKLGSVAELQLQNPSSTGSITPTAQGYSYLLQDGTKAFLPKQYSIRLVGAIATGLSCAADTTTRKTGAGDCSNEPFTDLVSQQIDLLLWQ